MTKQLNSTLRKTLREQRAQLSPAFQTKASQAICTRIQTTELYQKAQRIALYFSNEGEVDLTSLWHDACRKGKLCYFPELQADATLSFLPATPDTECKKNKYGILEPKVSSDLVLAVDDLDLILLPLVAFDQQCTRLGMGGGYYDRTLANKKNGGWVGVAYQCQQVEYIERQPWDIPLDAVITEQELYWRH